MVENVKPLEVFLTKLKRAIDRNAGFKNATAFHYALKLQPAKSSSDKTERSAKSISDGSLHSHGTTQLHQAPSTTLRRKRGPEKNGKETERD